MIFRHLRIFTYYLHITRSYFIYEKGKTNIYKSDFPINHKKLEENNN